MSKMAAPLTRMSTPPASATARATMASIDSRLVTSRRTASAPRPMARAVSSASRSRMSATMTRAPSSA
jgi:hypothetical protein